MAADTWLEVRSGVLVVRKQFDGDGPGCAGANAGDPGPDGRHKAEHRWLAEAERHPVTRVLDVDVDRLIITTRFAGSETALSRIRPPGETARLLAAVASALGALHRHRLVHGKVGGDHIIIDGPRFTLCSPSGLADDPTSDVAAFYPLIHLLCGRWAKSGRYRPELLEAWRDVGTWAVGTSVSADRLGARLSDLAELPERPPRRRWNERRRLRPIEPMQRD